MSLRLAAYRRSLPNTDNDADILIVIGSPPEARDIVRLEKLGRRVYTLPGRGDDHYVARLFSSHSINIEGHIIYHGSGLYIAGIGGREPLANIKSINREVSELSPNKLILVSEYPPHGIFDYSQIGVRHGLFEVRDAIESWKPSLVIMGTCSDPGVARVDNVLYVCVPLPACVASVTYSGDKFYAEVSCNTTRIREPI
ncbi:hypothetical protein Pyrde_1711 [Pyrodictium delaneyi]|uniref:Uncharacterized protein n=1 Tax=Pyrodictium delaneyi TaxID=1273541 RepID=A0A0P0N534_9CREN|nr:hypothetical protein [Pyrodictium delaneyi]ALL01754.1 hypothetical protein Pyrde_1711 [Pyrodictium delaneyi]OWJ55025.1 hypothetical protein Pdsh_04855 [Pyrodictium delaneyi]